MIFEGKKSRGQEVKQKTNKPSPLVGERIYGRTSETSLDCEQIEQAVAIATFAKLCERGVNSRQGRVRGNYGLPRPHFVRPRNDEATCHPAFIAGSHQKEILKPLQEDPFCTKSVDFGKRRQVQDGMNATIQRKIAPTLTLPHKGGDKNSFPNEGRLGWVPIKNAVAKLNNKAAFTKPSRATNEVRGELASTETLSFRCKSERWRLMRGAAFTLAEVLITLGIIGVVAAMTMPALIQHHQKQVVVTKLKKIYSVMNQAIQAATAENGDINGWIIDCGPSNSPTCSSDEAQKWFQDYIGKHLNILKYEQDDDGHILAYLNDGSILKINRYLYDMIFYLDAKALKNYNNGIKTFGRSSFGFRFNPVILAHQNTDENLSPLFEPYAHDWDGTREDLFNNANYGCLEKGTYCTKLIQYDGWKISKDYPWK